VRITCTRPLNYIASDSHTDANAVEGVGSLGKNSSTKLKEKKKLKKEKKTREKCGRSKREIRKTVQLNTLSWYLTCGGSQWDVAYLPDSWNSVTCVGMASEHTSMVCIAQKPRVDSRCESLYRSGLFYYSNPDELEKGTISIRRENRLKRSPKQAHLAHSEQTEIVTAKKMWVRDKRWTLRCNVC